MAYSAQASLLTKMERGLLLSRPARFHNNMQLMTQRNPVKLLPAPRHCASQANSQPETSPPALQQESQKPSATGQLVNLMDYWDPFSINTRSLRQMMSVMDKLFGEIPTSSTDLAYIRAPWDVMEDENSYHIRIELPGFGKDEVKVHVDDGILIVNAQRNEESGDHQNKWSTRTRGSYRTKCALPKNVEANKVVAKLNNGVLEIHLPKGKKEAQLIDVKVE